ncbi:MAG: hypothetical protein ACRCVJ_18810 [Clostridium sp.]|uniref:hypothetical protein n=1 Tax=Clostridium sp. TaxID=1506 RepID=UPI003F3EFAF0
MNLFKEYLDETTKSENSKRTYEYDYKSYVEPYQNAHRKNIVDFNEDDVIEIINSVVSASRSTKYKIFMMIKGFEQWAIERGFNHSYNPCDNIDFDEVVNINKSMLISKYMTRGMFKNIIMKAIGLNIEPQLIIPMFLSRLGLKGREFMEIRALKWCDIDFEKRVINVTDRSFDTDDKENIIKIIGLDEWQVEFLKKAKSDMDESIKNGYVNYGYIIMGTKKSDAGIQGKGYIRNKLDIFYREVDENYVTYKDLVKSAKFDALFDVLNYKKTNFIERDPRKIQQLNYLTNLDFIAVQQYFEVGSSISSYSVLKKDFVAIFGEDDISVRKREDSEELIKISEEAVRKVVAKE